MKTIFPPKVDPPRVDNFPPCGGSPVGRQFPISKSKAVVAALTLALLVLVMPVFIFAATGFCEIAEGVSVPCPLGEDNVGPSSSRTAGDLISNIIYIALMIVGSVSVLFLIIGGFRYVTASGNEEQSEAAKKTLTHAIIGLVIVILSFVIVRVISNALILGTPL